MTVTIRPMQATAWEVVRGIYAEGIASGHATFEEHPPEWNTWDRDHLDNCRIVAVVNAILGWAALSAVSGRRVYAGVAEVSVYVSANARGKGVGMSLLQALIAASEAAGIWTLQAGIFPENMASIRLHEKNGFHIIGKRERIGKMNDSWRDVVLLERRSDKIGL